MQGLVWKLVGRHHLSDQTAFAVLQSLVTYSKKILCKRSQFMIPAFRMPWRYRREWNKEEKSKGRRTRRRRKEVVERRTRSPKSHGWWINLVGLYLWALSFPKTQCHPPSLIMKVTIRVCCEDSMKENTQVLCRLVTLAQLLILINVNLRSQDCPEPRW